MPEMQQLPGFVVPRRWKRYDIQVPLRVIVHRDEVVRRINGRGTELNEGGMGVFAGVELPLGEQIEVEFTPPYTNTPLRLWGAVRNRSGYYYGLEFLTENTGERAQVERFRQILRTTATIPRA